MKPANLLTSISTSLFLSRSSLMAPFAAAHPLEPALPAPASSNSPLSINATSSPVDAGHQRLSRQVWNGVDVGQPVDFPIYLFEDDACIIAAQHTTITKYAELSYFKADDGSNFTFEAVMFPVRDLASYEQIDFDMDEVFVDSMWSGFDDITFCRPLVAPANHYRILHH